MASISPRAKRTHTSVTRYTDRTYRMAAKAPALSDRQILLPQANRVKHARRLQAMRMTFITYWMEAPAISMAANGYRKMSG